ncbi:MAG: phenylacetate-CoA oxygenase subunit PaaI [Chloroflexi bacterium]|nr:phenylacetate-CoA oxygenase subunit PaaI [Chloroflexota bacterium]
MAKERKTMFDQDIDREIAERMKDEYGVAGSDRELDPRWRASFKIVEEIKPEHGPGEVEGPEQSPSQEYREALINLLEMQADSELAGALGYVPCVKMAPTVEEFLAASMIVKDEFRHARVVYKLLEYLGIDVNARLQEHDFTLRVEEDQTDLGTRRVAADKRVNIFYYPIDTWYDFVAFNFCMDRGAGHQLEDVLESSYKPWARVMEGIFKEEKFHIAHGDSWVRQLAQNPETHDKMQEALNKWYPRTMNIFGRPRSSKNKLYRRLGLKKRDNDEVRQAFAAEVKERCQAFGLQVSEWKPEWERLPEEAFVTG